MSRLLCLLNLLLLESIRCLDPSYQLQTIRKLNSETTVPPMFAPPLAIIPAKDRKKQRLKLSDLEFVTANIDDMAEASGILVSSFFENAALNPTFHAIRAHREHLRLREHHGGEEHVQTIVRWEGEPIAFVDVDARPKGDPELNPRPYISDLAVRPEFRRQGIATQLVLYCEDIVQRIWQKQFVYLRVETKNAVALRMYANLGYELFSHNQIQGKATLRKSLQEASTQTLSMKDVALSKNEENADFSCPPSVLSSFSSSLYRRTHLESPSSTLSSQ